MLLRRQFDNEGVRLATLLVGLFALAALLLGVIIYVTAGRAMRAELHDFISADRGAVLSGYRGEGLAEAVEVVNQLTAVPRLAARYLLQDQRGRRLAGNLPAMPARAGSLEVRETGAHPVLGEGSFLPDGTYLFVGESTDRLAGARIRILRSFAGVIGATLLLALAVGGLLSARYRRRIDAIIRTCRQVEAGSFGERVPMGGSQGQLDRLSATINAMLERIAALMESLRQVSSDIAHDLRTPLTRLRQQLESAHQASLSGKTQEAAIESALQDCDAILTLFSALLRISQIEAGTRRANFGEVDIAVLLQRLLEIYTPVVEDGHQQLQLNSSAPVGALTVAGDRMLLTQMFSNLLENAIRHAGRGARIRIDCRLAERQVQVQILDSGPGIPADEREKVFHRLYRLERSRNTPGNGLGLALVAAIVKLHRFEIDLSDAAPGLCVTLKMPQLTAPDAVLAALPVSA